MVGIPLEKLQVGGYAVRSGDDDDAIAALASSISRIGVLNPLYVVPGGDGYTVVSGHRRLAACRKISLATVPCVITASSDAGLKETAIAENVFRKDLTPMELAAALQDILKAGTMNQQELADCMHRSINWVADMVGILAWPASLQQALHAKQISLSAARNLAMIDDEVYLQYLVDCAAENGATARSTAAWLQSWRAAKPATEAVQAPPVPGRPELPPMVPFSPCLGCKQDYRTDSIPHMPLCPHCLQMVRDVQEQGLFNH